MAPGRVRALPATKVATLNKSVVGKSRQEKADRPPTFGTESALSLALSRI